MNLTSPIRLLLLAAVATACSDFGDLAGPDASDELRRSDLPGPGPHSDGLPRFALELRATGSMHPGTPIQIVGTVRALLPTLQASIRLSLPDIVAAERSGWRPTPLPRDEQLPFAATSSRPVHAGDVAAVSATVTPTEPGYYRAVLVAEKTSDEPNVLNAHWVQDVAVQELWLYVDAERGRVTPVFDTLVFSSGEARVPGVRRSHHGSGRQGGVSTPGSHGPSGADAILMSAPPRASMGWGEGMNRDDNGVGVHVGYFDSYANTFRSLAGVNVDVEVWRREEFGDVVLGGFGGTTDQWGEVIWPCPADIQEYHKVIVRELETGTVRMDGIVPTDPLYVDDYGCQAVWFSIEMPSMDSHVFANMKDLVIPASRSFFGRSRGQILVDLDPNVDVSYYQKQGWPSGLEYIKLRHSAVWGSGGLRTQSHEYGHAVHEKALGGNVASGSCPSPHYVSGYYNLQCAYSEGFANYHAAATMGTAAEWTTTFENYTSSSWFDPTGNGATSEGTVAAFLYDLTDPANETWDTVQYPGSYIADLIISCQILRNTWGRANGIDFLIYCLENTVDPTIRDTYFVRPPYPAISQQHTATLPTGWSRDAIRRLWKKNLFGVN